MADKTPLWVRLYLVPQTEGANTMPPFVEGLLLQETAGSYILNPMLETRHDEETYEPYNVPVGMNFVSKTYVWRCQVLESKPEASDKPASEEGDYEEGGLG